jgi:RNase adapter protein RapZ
MIVVSFGYKSGVPLAEIIIDVRKLVRGNPHSEPRLRNLTGRDLEVRKWLSAYTNADAVADTLTNRFAPMVGQKITVALGCVGGRHRSVYLAERIAASLGVPFQHLALRDEGPVAPPLDKERKLHF